MRSTHYAINAPDTPNAELLWLFALSIKMTAHTYLLS